MLTNQLITRKLPLLMIALAVFSSFVTGIIVFTLTSEKLVDAASKEITSQLASRKSSLEAHFDIIEQDLAFHADSPLVSGALQEFSAAWELLPDKKEDYLRAIYIDRNPYQELERSAFITAKDESSYTTAHTKYHSIFKNLMETRDFHDVFLIDPDGNLIYSVAKENDYSTNLITGKWKDTGLAQVFRAIDRNPKHGARGYSDFARYAPSGNMPAGFIGAPVFTRQLDYVGALILQMPIDTLNKVMQVTAGMGKTGETYLVGDDHLMRSDSRFLPKGQSILQVEVNTSVVAHALEGKTGIELVDDYRGIPVFSAYDSVEFLGVRWAVMADIDKQEVLQPTREIGLMLLLTSLILVSVITVVGYLLSLTFAKPINVMTDMMMRLARNDLDIPIARSGRKDEIGQMENAMVVFKQSAVERNRLQKRLSHLAHHDHLTGLPTRKFAIEKLNEAIERAEADDKIVAVMFADLDKFKAVNDNLGHLAGDELIKRISKILQETLRDGDTVGRVGGDEFIIILPDLISSRRAEKIAANLLSAVEEASMSFNKQHLVSLSIGIALYPQDSTDTSELIKCADQAMYKSKRSRSGDNDLRRSA